MPYLVLIVIGITLAVYVIWIVTVLLYRLIAILLTIAAIAAALGLLVGIGVGLILPLRVLRGNAKIVPQVATPAALRAGEVVRRPPRGPSANFGWDPGWPMYVPYQLKYDQRAVVSEAKALCARVHAGARSRLPSMSGIFGRFIVAVLGFGIVGIPTWGFILGVSAGTALWSALIWLFGMIVRCIQSLGSWLTRSREARFMRKTGATVRCTRCYNSFNMPSYLCPNPQCGRFHRDVSPGILGIRRRICECETQIPLTVKRASKAMKSFCPFCNDSEELPEASGTRRVVVVPVFGSVGVGKTRFLSSSIVSLEKMQQNIAWGASLTPLNSSAEGFLKTSMAEHSALSAPIKTRIAEQPEGYPYLLDRPGEPIELHLMDAAGEKFLNIETSASLRYFDRTKALIFLVDPLAIPEVGDQIRLSSNAGKYQVSQGTADDSYSSVVERLRSSGMELSKRRLAVVVSKADAVATIMPERPLPLDSDGVRAWLHDHGEDRLLARLEMDFQHVEYFAVSALSASQPTGRDQPVDVISWAVKAHGGLPLIEEAPVTAVPSASEESI